MSREILLLVDALAHEKNVSKDIIFSAVEEALASATKKKYPDDVDIIVDIDQETGEYKSFRKWTVIPDCGIISSKIDEVFFLVDKIISIYLL